MTCNGCTNLMGKGCGKYGDRTPPEGFADKCGHRDVPDDYVEPEKDCPNIKDDAWCVCAPEEGCDNWFAQGSDNRWTPVDPVEKAVLCWRSRKTMCRADRCEFYKEYFG